MSIISCACCSGKSYAECCQPFHANAIVAQTPEQLMRSRYCAYALHLIDYLWDTTHPSKRHLYSKNEIGKWAKDNHWVGLEVVNAKKDVVEFKAFYQHGLKEYTHHERSVFKKEAGKWYYFSGEHFH
ncbi:hypothetical protein D3C87_662130 [compost metagenome]